MPSRTSSGSGVSEGQSFLVFDNLTIKSCSSLCESRLFVDKAGFVAVENPRAGLGQHPVLTDAAATSSMAYISDDDLFRPAGGRRGEARHV